MNKFNTAPNVRSVETFPNGIEVKLGEDRTIHLVKPINDKDEKLLVNDDNILMFARKLESAMSDEHLQIAQQHTFQLSEDKETQVITLSLSDEAIVSIYYMLEKYVMLMHDKTENEFVQEDCSIKK